MQELDTQDAETPGEKLWFYFPFTTLAEKTVFTSSGISSGDAGAASVIAKIVTVDDIVNNLLEWEKVTPGEELIVCRTGTIYISGICGIPGFSIKVEELNTDYKFSFLSADLPLESKLFYYQWMEPGIVSKSGSSSDSFLNTSKYIKSVVSKITGKGNNGLIFKPGIASDVEVTFRAKVMPGIYTRLIPNKIIETKTILTNNINCPTLSISPAIDMLVISNNAFKNITISAIISNCVATFNIQSVQFIMVYGSALPPFLNYFTRINNTSINITEDAIGNYIPGLIYTLLITVNVSMISSSNEAFINTISSSIKIKRVVYSLVFSLEGNAIVSQYDTMSVRAHYSVYLNGEYNNQETSILLIYLMNIYF